MSVNRSDLSRRFVEKGAKAYHYAPGTTTPLVVYQDSSGSAPHPYPIQADASGRMPAIYVPYGSYRERVTSRYGTVLWDDDSVPNPAPVTITGGSADPDLLKETGDIIARFQAGPKVGYVRLNGRTIGNASSGATERANSDCENLFLHLWAALTNDEAPVSGGRGVSAAADWAASKTLTLPSTRLRSLFGAAAQGGVAIVPDAAATIPSGKSDTPGASFGSEVHTVTVDQMPQHNHGGVTGTQVSRDVVPTFTTNTVTAAAFPQYNLTVATGAVTETPSQSGHSISNQGGGAAHNNMPPGLFVTYYIKL